MLKFKLNKADFEKLDESTKAFYKASGDDYLLQIDGAVDKDKLDEFRATNVELMKKNDLYKDIDIEKYRKLEESERKQRDKTLIDKGEIDKLIEEKTTALKSDYEAKINSLTENLNSTENKYKTTISKYEIEGAAFKAFADHKIRPEANEAILAQIRNKFSIDNGKVIAKNGDVIETGKNGNLTIDEFVSSQPDFMRVANSSGSGRGSDGGNNNNNTEKTSSEKIRSGLEKLMQ